MLTVITVLCFLYNVLGRWNIYRRNRATYSWSTALWFLQRTLSARELRWFWNSCLL